MLCCTSTLNAPPVSVIFYRVPGITPTVSPQSAGRELQTALLEFLPDDIAVMIDIGSALVG